MKTAISIPEFIFHPVSERAIELGISRSEFFVHAAQRYLDELDQDSLVNAIDATIDAADDSNAIAASAGRRMLAATSDEW